MQRDLQRLLHDDHASIITTMLDYYALPKDSLAWHFDCWLGRLEALVVPAHAADR